MSPNTFQFFGPVDDLLILCLHLQPESIRSKDKRIPMKRVQTVHEMATNRYTPRFFVGM